jgi:hypothetical protein
LLAIVAKGTPEFEPGTKHSYSIGIYSTPGAPAKATVTREGATLFFQPPGAASAVPLEATAADKFQIEGAVVLSFDAARKQMTVKRRGGGERVFTKEE